METINPRKMVHSLYGWVERVHTSPKVGYSPSPKKREREREREREKERKKAPQSTCMGIIDFETVEDIFSGPYSSKTSRQYKKTKNRLTHSVCAS